MFDKEILSNTWITEWQTHQVYIYNILYAQYLIRSKFPGIGGLRSTLLQQKKVAPLEPNSLQIIHLPGH